MLDGITPRTIKDFDIYLKNVRRLAPVTCGMHMAHLKAIINQAIRDRRYHMTRILLNIMKDQQECPKSVISR